MLDGHNGEVVKKLDLEQNVDMQVEITLIVMEEGVRGVVNSF